MKKKTISKMLFAATVIVSLISYQKSFSLVDDDGGDTATKTHSCIRKEWSDTLAILECKDSGKKCATVSECK